MPDNKDDEVMSGDDGGDLGSQTQGKKGGLLSPFLVKILGIAATVIGMIIVATIVSIIVINVAKPSSGGTSLPDVEDIKRSSVTHLEYLKFDDAFRQQLVDGRMIQLKIALGYKPKDKPLQTELTQIIPELRDIIIKQLSRLRSEYFADENALDRLEEDLLKQINRIVNSGKVERIYFQEYTLM